MTDGLTASDVAVLTGGTGKNDGFGGDWGAWIILFLIFGMFGWGGFGGWGGNGGGANSPAFQGYATVPISTQRCPRRESKTGSRTFPASFATALLA